MKNNISGIIPSNYKGCRFQIPIPILRQGKWSRIVEYVCSRVSVSPSKVNIETNGQHVSFLNVIFTLFIFGWSRGVFVLWTRELMNQFLKNHQLNKAEIVVTDESISDWTSGSQDTFSSIQKVFLDCRRFHKWGSMHFGLAFKTNGNQKIF